MNLLFIFAHLIKLFIINLFKLYKTNFLDMINLLFRLNPNRVYPSYLPTLA